MLFDKSIIKVICWTCKYRFWRWQLLWYYDGALSFFLFWLDHCGMKIGVSGLYKIIQIPAFFLRTKINFPFFKLWVKSWIFILPFLLYFSLKFVLVDKSIILSIFQIVYTIILIHISIDFLFSFNLDYFYLFPFFIHFRLNDHFVQISWGGFHNFINGVFIVVFLIWEVKSTTHLLHLPRWLLSLIIIIIQIKFLIILLV